MWTIFKVFIKFVTILLLLYVLVFWPRGMWDLNSPTRDPTHNPCIGRWSLNHWIAREVPPFQILQRFLHWIYLCWNSGELQLQTSIYSVHQAVQLLLVMTFLCFLEALPGPLAALCMGPMVLFKVYGIILNTMKNTPEQWKRTYYSDTQFTGEIAPRVGMITCDPRLTLALQQQEEATKLLQ